MPLKITGYNLKQRVTFENEPKTKCEFVKVKDLDDLSKPFKVLGMHTIANPKSAFGDSVFVCVKYGKKAINVDLPKSAIEIVNAICEDEEAVAEIDSGKVGIVLSLYRSEKYKKDNCTSYRFCEINAKGEEVKSGKKCEDEIPF